MVRTVVRHSYHATLGRKVGGFPLSELPSVPPVSSAVKASPFPAFLVGSPRMLSLCQAAVRAVRTIVYESQFTKLAGKVDFIPFASVAVRKLLFVSPSVLFHFRSARFASSLESSTALRAEDLFKIPKPADLGTRGLIKARQNLGLSDTSR